MLWVDRKGRGETLLYTLEYDIYLQLLNLFTGVRSNLNWIILKQILGVFTIIEELCLNPESLTNNWETIRIFNDILSEFDQWIIPSIRLLKTVLRFKFKVSWYNKVNWTTGNYLAIIPKITVTKQYWKSYVKAETRLLQS